MKLAHAGIGLLALGIVLILAAVFWTRIVPNETVWTEEKAEAYQVAAKNLHDRSFDKEISSEELEETRAEYQALNKQLSRAKTAKFGLPGYFRMIGVISSLAGVIMIAAQQKKE